MKKEMGLGKMDTLEGEGKKGWRAGRRIDGRREKRGREKEKEGREKKK